MPFDYLEELFLHDWEEGKVIRLVRGSYRHRIDIICSRMGKNIAAFANGEHRYCACISLIRRDGSEIGYGNCIVPRLPNYHFLMVIERRPALDENGKLIIASSLEFPGGAIEGESVTLGCLRECREETGIPRQRAVLYRRKPIDPFNCDVVCRNYCCVVFLTEGKFEARVETDGGLEVVSMSHEEVEAAMWDGTVVHGPSHHAWSFYQNLIILDPLRESRLIKSGSLTKELVTI